MTGPLSGLRIVELGAMGPAPFACMLLADHGAEVIRIDRPGRDVASREVMVRSRTLIELDLKSPEDAAKVREMVRSADGFVEGYRPGAMERLGLGPDQLLADNPRLVYGRMTGWGQTGPYAHLPGHDINYIAVSGALHAIGAASEPVVPLSLVGDFGGGGMMLAFAMCSALLHVQRTGVGQVIDCSMYDGANLLMTSIYELLARGLWRDERAANLIDGGSHYYGIYPTADGKFVSVGAMEPQFHALLLDKLGLGDDPDFAQQHDPARWPSLRAKMQAVFRTRTRAEWCALLQREEVCLAPVLNLMEAMADPQAVARQAFVDVGGVPQPAPAPRFSATPLDAPRVPQPARLADILP